MHDIQEVLLSTETPSFVLHHRRRSARALAGLRYERKAKAKLGRENEGKFLPGPWFKYTTRSSPRRWNYVQLDTLLIDILCGRIILVEVKLSHTSDAYFQLLDKYLPVVRKFFGAQWTYSLVEMVRWYDRDVAFPTKVQLLENPMEARPHEFSVHIWNPSRD